MNSYLAHHGIKGQKWGVRRYQNPDGSYTNEGKRRYGSTSPMAYIARKSNDKVDAGFKKWNKNAERKANAISSGKNRNKALVAYKTGSGDRKTYRSAEKQYRRDLRKNTTYRKGSVKQEVGRDLSRKYLSEAKRIENQLKKNPNDRKLQKQYSKLMSAHDIERAKARRAQQVAANRMYKKASLKRKATIAVKAALLSTAVGVGVKYAKDKGYLGDNMTSDRVLRYIQFGKQVFKYV